MKTLYLIKRLTADLKSTAQEIKFSIKDFFSKLRIWSHLLINLMQNFIFCAVKIVCLYYLGLIQDVTSINITCFLSKRPWYKNTNELLWDALRDLVPSVQYRKCENNYGGVLLINRSQCLSLNYESECLTVLYLSIPELVREHKIDSKKKHYPNNSSHYSRTLKNEKI